MNDGSYTVKSMFFNPANIFTVTGRDLKTLGETGRRKRCAASKRLPFQDAVATIKKH